MSEPEEAQYTEPRPEYQQYSRGGHPGRWRGRGRSRGGHRIDPSVAKALDLFGVTDLREFLNQKHEEEKTNMPSPDSAEDYSQRSRGERRYSERGPQTRIPRSRSGEPFPQSSRGRGRYSSRSSERAPNSYKPLFIKNPSNITVKLTTSTGLRSCELDSDTQLADIRHIPDYKLTDQATQEILNNSLVGRGRGNMYRGRGVGMRGRGMESRDRENQFRGRGSEFRGRGIEFRGRGNEFRDRGNEVRGRGNEVRERGNEFRDRGNEVRERGNEVRERGNEFRGRDNAFRGRDNEFRGWGNEFRGRGNEYRGRGNEYRGRGNEFRGRGNEFRGRGVEFKNRPNYVRGGSVRTRNYRGSRMRGQDRGQVQESLDTRGYEAPPPNTEESWDDVDPVTPSTSHTEENIVLPEQESEEEEHGNEEKRDPSHQETEGSYELLPDYEENELFEDSDEHQVDNSNDGEDIDQENVKINLDEKLVVTTSNSEENKKRSVRFDLENLKDDSKIKSHST